MRKTLFLRFSDPAGEEACWAALDQQGLTKSPHGKEPLAQIAQAATGYRVVVFVPGIDAILTHASVPTQNRRRIAQALPYTLEERLAEDIDALHFAPGQRRPDGELAVVVVARERMDRWMSALQAAQIYPEVVLPETLAVPYEPDGWSILITPEIVLVRTGTQSGFTSEPENLAAMTSIALQECETPPIRVRVIGCAEGIDLQPTLQTLTAAGAEVVTESCPGEILDCLVRGFSEQHALNLLQGHYSRREQLDKLWRPWRPAAAILLAWLLLQGVTSIVDYRQLTRENQALAQRIEQTFRTAFPEVRKIVDPKVQMERGLAELNGKLGGGTAGFLGLLERTGSVLKETPGLELNGASYRDGYLDLDLMVNDLQVLDQLKQRLTKSGGLEAEIQSATANDKRVRSRLRIRSMPS